MVGAVSSKARAVPLLVAVGMILATAGIARAASWSIQERVPSHVGNLSAISCPSSTACTAVGEFYTATAMRWDGRRWAVQNVPKAPGDQDFSAFGLSCPSVNACMVVGYYEKSVLTGSTAYAERWNGARWLPQPIPRLPFDDPFPSLATVSCSSARACTAVGAILTSITSIPVQAVAERWNGTTWTMQTMPAVPGARNVEFNGVSCASSSSCIAVGVLATENGLHPVAADWDGTGWSVQTMSEIPGTTDEPLSVSCISNTACMAVGDYGPGDGFPQHTLAEWWNGTSWTIESTPNPAGNNQLKGVSCVSAEACTAVGSAVNVSAYSTLAEHWDGTSWTIEPTPSPPGTGSWLTTVSCPSSLLCLAGGLPGGTSSTPLVEQWGNTAPQLPPAPAPAPATATLSGIPSRCVRGSVVIHVNGAEISTVAWRLNSRKVRGHSVRRGSRYSASIRLSPGPHKLTVEVRFKSSSQTPRRTFHRAMFGCRTGPPEFTG